MDTTQANTAHELEDGEPEDADKTTVYRKPPMQTEPAQPTATDPPPARHNAEGAGFKARYVNGGTELVSSTQGKEFIPERRIEISTVLNLLDVEAAHAEVREVLHTPEGMSIGQHAELVGSVWRAVAERTGLSIDQRLAETTQAETILSEYEIAVSAKYREQLESTRRVLEDELAKTRQAHAEKEAAFERDKTASRAEIARLDAQIKVLQATPP